jgi:translation initiation factor 1A
MPKKNTQGGKKFKRGKGNPNDEIKRELAFAVDDQVYGKILKMLGNARCSVLCSDNQERLGTICGKMRQKIWININDLVLISLRDFQDAKCDIIHKYNDSEARMLKAHGELNNDKCNIYIATGGDNENGEDSDDNVLEFVEDTGTGTGINLDDI